MSDCVSRAREVLLRALEDLDKAIERLEVPVEQVQMIVVTQVGGVMKDGRWTEIKSWNAAPGSLSHQAELLRIAAGHIEDSGYPPGESPDD